MWKGTGWSHELFSRAKLSGREVSRGGHLVGDGGHGELLLRQQRDPALELNGDTRVDGRGVDVHHSDGPVAAVHHMSDFAATDFPLPI